MDKSLFFIAILPPKTIYANIKMYQKIMSVQFNSHKSFGHIPHLTLVPPFHIDAENEDNLKRLLKKHTIEHFDIKLNNFSHFKKHTIFIDVKLSDELYELQDSLIKTLNNSENILLKKISYFQKFRPHITIGYKDVEPNFKDAWEYFEKARIGDKFECDNFSLLKHNGSKWDIIEI